MSIKSIISALFKDNTDSVFPDADSLRLENAVQFGRFSFELEEKREQSLITQSGHMLTAISLYSAALFMLLPVVVTLDSVSTAYLWGCSFTVFFPLVIGLVSTLLAQWRYKYKTLIDGMDFFETFASDAETDGTYNSQSDFDYQWLSQLRDVQASKKTVNDKRLFFIKVSMISFLISIAFLVMAWFIIAIIVL